MLSRKGLRLARISFLVVLLGVALACGAAEPAPTPVPASEIAAMVKEAVTESVPEATDPREIQRMVQEAVSASVPSATDPREIQRMVQAAIAAGPGVSKADIEAAIRAQAGDQMTADDVKRVVDAAIAAMPAPQLDTDVIRPLVEQAVASSVPEGVSSAEIARMVEAAVSGATQEVPTRGELEASIAKSVQDVAAGQLTVADVQKIVDASMTAAVSQAATEAAEAAASKAAQEAAKAASEAAAMAAAKAAQEAAQQAVAVAPGVQFKEAPALAQLVSVGKLPPVEERLPEDPMVVVPFGETGKYGGTLRSVVLGVSLSISERWYRTGLVRPSTDGATVLPNVAKSWDVSEDGTVTTFHLRKGMKWSDGAPFTSADFVYWYEDVVKNEELTPSGCVYYLRVGDECGTLEAVDDYTVRYTFPAPKPIFFRILLPCGSWCLMAPAHWAKQFHKKYNPDVDKLAAEAGLDTWVQYYNANTRVDRNPETPDLGAWIPANAYQDQVVSFKRNPYYFGVDPDGNQLPYIDRLRFEKVSDSEILNLKAVGGEIDFQGIYIELANYSLLQENEARANFKLRLWPKSIGLDAGIYWNFSFQGPAKEYIHNKEFREALSLAIDRDTVNNNIFLGLGEARQLVPRSDHPFYPGDEYAKMHTEYNVEKANEILDRILPNKDSEGWRLASDGNRLEIPVVAIAHQGTDDVAQLVALYWQAVGISATFRDVSAGVVIPEYRANELPLLLYIMDTALPFVRPGYTAPVTWWAYNGPYYGLYISSGGEEGIKPSQEMQELADLHLRGADVSDEEGVDIGKEIWRRYAEDLYVIGIIGQAPQPYIVSNRLGNVPEFAIDGPAYRSPSPAFLEQFFFRD